MIDDKLAKVLALAASDNDAEALHALRTARRLLEVQGTDFVDLAQRLAAGSSVDPAFVERLQDTVFDLRNELRQLRAENDRMKRAPTSLSQAAEDAAAAIRLRALLSEAETELEAERARLAQLEAAASRLLADARTEIDHLLAENRRLAGLVPAPVAAVEALPAPRPRKPARRGARAVPAVGQYALL